MNKFFALIEKNKWDKVPKTFDFDETLFIKSFISDLNKSI